MNSIRILIVSTFALSLAANADITSVSVPEEALQGDVSYPTRDSVFTVSVPPYPLNSTSGIGRILDNSGIGSDVAGRLFTLHSHLYAAPYVPISNSMVTYTFDRPTVIEQVEIVQHDNGVTRIDGFVGTNLASMTSIGNIFGPLGDVRGDALFVDGDTHVFYFTNTTPGTIFQFRITQTSQEAGYALYRAYPRDANGRRIPPAECATIGIRASEVEIFWPSHSNRLYTVEFRSQLTTNVWLPLTNVVGNGETIKIYDRVPPGAPQRFYRVQCPAE